MSENGNMKKTLSVMNMGRLLGLKKVESYWLVHKGYFDVITVNGKMRVVTDSFEAWYKGQTRYHKVNGEPPGSQLSEGSYSIRDIAGMLEISESRVYALIARTGMETIHVNSWMRVPKEAFLAWYNGQNHYRLKEDRERDADIMEKTMSMPEMARHLGIPREAVYSIIRSKEGKQYLQVVEIGDRKRITKESFEIWHQMENRWLNTKKSKKKPEKPIKKSKNEDYLTIEEASFVAGVGIATIMRWVNKGLIPAARISSKIIRIPRVEFEAFAAHHDKRMEGGQRIGIDSQEE